MKPNIEIMLIEDNPEYRHVIDIAMKHESDMTLVSQVGTAERALRIFDNARTRIIPDVILLDLNLPGMSGLDALPWLKKYTPETKVIVLTQSNQEADILDAISRGAAGYLLKSSTLDQITDGIRTVTSGGASLDPCVAQFILSKMQNMQATPDINELTEREMEVLTLISEGLQKKEVADKLNISARTVATHIEHIYEKLNVNNAPAAVAKAYKTGIFHSSILFI